MTPIEHIENFLAKNILSPKGYGQYVSGDVSKGELAQFCERLEAVSKAYVGHSVGMTLSSPIKDTTAAQAYALYYSVINAAKLIHLSPLLKFVSDEISVLDVGCGPGTAALALLSSLSHALQITCVESSAPMRSVAERLLSRWEGKGRVRSLALSSTLSGCQGASFDLVIAANVLAEMKLEDRDRLIEQLVSKVAPRGYLLLVEPGQQLHTRRLMELRDRLVLDSGLVPQFPCTRHDRCPMLSHSETDWCHGALEWRQPRLNAQLDDMLGFNKHRIKYTAFLFQNSGSLREGVRVVTEPVKGRSGVEATLCGEELYGVVRIRKGTRSEKNRPLEKASVWDRLRMNPKKEGDVEAETRFEELPL